MSTAPQTPAPSSSQFLTPAQLAARWQVTPMTLRRWRQSGKITALHLGRAVRFSLTEIVRIEREAQA
jgi:excisionase family DNA binding protein